MQGLTFVQGGMIRGAFDLTVIQNEPLSCHRVSKFISIKLSKSSLLADVGLLTARKLELGPAWWALITHLLYSLVARHYDLANVDPGHCILGLSKGYMHTCLEGILGTACWARMSTGKKAVSMFSEGNLWRQQATVCSSPIVGPQGREKHWSA